ncbi:MAG: glutaredoxin [Parcubacteria group bacterium GW2011_GWD2_38_12]|nr:MAG: glutaredoxin [Parcubacteria group bacterium GW2011_GWC2_36_17]KKQ42823.1 MAG: glutaredoxin [Parcubacteria group bacterium GW2011_GWE2_37_8]KKQ52328.1 MAG: glutaredoxin [Parcubacteria group bacterium GW2011_GWD2_38_12]KKQ58612.1 MAG: glutaredoxin [Parcubacteria group bacterium GW2011_GWC1_38_17]KKQ58627.1 MAG: glutaredoxin [Parcubacteria group bacterium GW2011_GWD1_38_16]
MIKIYSTPTCIYCKYAKEFFKKNNIEYTDLNVAEDEKAREEMISKSQQMGVPVIDIDGKLVVGFDQRKIEELLNLK